MKRGLLTLVAVASVLGVSACSSGDDDTPAATLTTATTSRATSTTQSVEAEVEAAYLRSWDVYADAVLRLDDSKLDTNYAGAALATVLDDVKKLREKNTPAQMSVEHDYSITFEESSGIAQVVDHYTNHSVLLDGATRKPIEADPNEKVDEQYLLQKMDGTWKVIDISPSQ